MTGFAVFDVDDTLINGQSQKALLSFLYSKRYIGVLTYLVIMFWFLLYKLGFISDPKRIATYAFSFLRGKSVQEFGSLVEEFFTTTLQEMFFQEAVELVRTHISSGREVILLSNAINPLVERIARHLNATSFICTRLEESQGRFTGKILGEVVFGPNKVRLLREYTEAHGLDFSQGWGYGDHYSDIGYLNLLAHPYAANPTSGLRKYAKQKHWNVIYFR